MKENNILEKLEDELKRGKVERKVVTELKDGAGKSIIYKDTMQHLDSRVYESGKIVLDEGSTIGKHKHVNDSEIWTVLQGRIEVNLTEYGPGASIVCKKGESHYAKNIANGKSFIRFVKRK